MSSEGERYVFERQVEYVRQPRTLVRHETEAVSIGDLLEAFESFLRGCGFAVDGAIEIVPDLPKKQEQSEEVLGCCRLDLAHKHLVEQVQLVDDDALAKAADEVIDTWQDLRELVDGVCNALGLPDTTNDGGPGDVALAVSVMLEQSEERRRRIEELETQLATIQGED